MLVLTFFEYGGLNQITFRFRFLFSLLRKIIIKKERKINGLLRTVYTH